MFLLGLIPSISSNYPPPNPVSAANGLFIIQRYYRFMNQTRLFASTSFISEGLLKLIGAAPTSLCVKAVCKFKVELYCHLSYIHKSTR